MLPRWIQDYALVGLIAVVVVGWFALRGDPAPPPVEGSAPQVLLTRTDGQTFDLAAHQGEPVLLVFWAEWCGACKSQIDDLNRLQAEHGDDVAILGVAVDSGNDKAVRRHAERFGIDFPVATADRATVQQYKVSALPTNVFVDASGDITDAVVGALDYRGFSKRLALPSP